MRRYTTHNIMYPTDLIDVEAKTKIDVSPKIFR
jgi:hypothetical protein